MSYWKKLGNSLTYNGLLGVGLLGMLLSRKQYVPECMGPAFYGVAVVGLYISVAYLLDDDDNNKERISRLTAKIIMEGLKPAVEKQKAEKAENEDLSVQQFQTFLSEVEEDALKVYDWHREQKEKKAVDKLVTENTENSGLKLKQFQDLLSKVEKEAQRVLEMREQGEVSLDQAEKELTNFQQILKVSALKLHEQAFGGKLSEIVKDIGTELAKDSPPDERGLNMSPFEMGEPKNLRVEPLHVLAQPWLTRNDAEIAMAEYLGKISEELIQVVDEMP